MNQVLHKAVDENGNIVAKGFVSRDALLKQLEFIIQDARKRDLHKHHVITLQEYIVYRKEQ